MSDDLKREINKVRQTLEQVKAYLEHQARMNAALHASNNVLYSPLHTQVCASLYTLDVLDTKTDVSSGTAAEVYIDNKLVAATTADGRNFDANFTHSSGIEGVVRVRERLSSLG